MFVSFYKKTELWKNSFLQYHLICNQSISLHISLFPFRLWRTVMTSLSRTETLSEQHNEIKGWDILHRKMTQYKLQHCAKELESQKMTSYLKRKVFCTKWQLYITYLVPFCHFPSWRTSTCRSKNKWLWCSYILPTLTKHPQLTRHKTGGGRAYFSESVSTSEGVHCTHIHTNVHRQTKHTHNSFIPIGQKKKIKIQYVPNPLSRSPLARGLICWVYSCRSVRTSVLMKVYESDDSVQSLLSKPKPRPADSE